MRFELYTEVVLARDLPELGLRRGDLVKLVDHHVAPDGEEGYSIEVFNAVGETIAVSSVPANALEACAKMQCLVSVPWQRLDRSGDDPSFSSTLTAVQLSNAEQAARQVPKR